MQSQLELGRHPDHGKSCQFLILLPFPAIPPGERCDSGHCSSWLCFPKLVDDASPVPQLQALGEAQSFFRAQVKALGLAGRAWGAQVGSWAGEDVATLAFLEWVRSAGLGTEPADQHRVHLRQRTLDPEVLWSGNILREPQILSDLQS